MSTTLSSRLDGKAALVTGGSRGMGAAIALALAHHGADVAVAYRDNAEQAASVAKQIGEMGRRTLTIQADAASPTASAAAVDQTAAEFGRFDILVSNAGIFPTGLIDEISPEVYDRTMAIHARAPFFAAQAAVRHMAGSGRIISVGSCIVNRVPFQGVSLYAMSKAALTGMTKGLARDLGPRGITVNVVQPGPIDTDMNPASSENSGDQRALTALGRYGESADIAATVTHLAGEGGRYVTGAEITVDGGWSA